ncbi:MAG: HPF/RaiA family ribosome-associated protein [Solirubrobacterales bacterium]
MHIEVTTDHNVDGSEMLTNQIVGDAETALARFADQLTRVEVHLADENAGKGGGADKRCKIEARPAGQQPVAVTNHGATVDDAFSGALRKLGSLLERRFGRLDLRKGGATVRRAEES